MTKTSDLPANPYEGKALSDEAQLGQREQVVLPPAAPSFTLSGGDPLAPILVKHWAELSKHNKNVEPWERERARKIALAMELWQKDQGIAP
jgi:hypothetical protein